MALGEQLGFVEIEGSNVGLWVGWIVSVRKADARVVMSIGLPVGADVEKSTVGRNVERGALFGVGNGVGSKGGLLADSLDAVVGRCVGVSVGPKVGP